MIFLGEVLVHMKREDLLDFNFDWHDDSTFKEALNESSLSEKEKIRLRDERMRRLELEALKEESGGYDDYYDDDNAEETAAENDIPAEKKTEKAKKKNAEDNSVIVSIKEDYPIRKIAVALMMSVFIAILPYISYLHYQPLTNLTAKYFSSEKGKITDWFLFQKEFCVVLAAVILSGLFMVDEVFFEKHWKDIPLRKKSMRLPVILTGVYALLLIVSGIASEHKELVLMGIVKHYEGLLGVLGYLVIFLMAMNYFCDTKSLEIFSWAMIITTLACAIFGEMEYNGHALQETDFMAHLMAPPEEYEYATMLRSTSSNVHITFFNSNYLGSFCGLMFPLALALGLGSKDVIKKILGIAAAAGIAVCAVFSNSTGGLYSIAASCVILFLIYLVYWCRNLINRQASLIGFIAAVAVIAGGAAFVLNTNADIRQRVDTIVNNGSGQKMTVEERRQRLAKDHYVLKDIRQEGSNLVLDDYSGNSITVTYTAPEDGNNELKYYDTKGSELEMSTDNDRYERAKDKRYRNCKFKWLEKTKKLTINLGYDKNLIFAYEDDKFKPFVHGMYTQDKINSYKGPEFFKKDLRAVSGRYFIWGTTISMLDECLFIGKGSGNFVTVFPQYDYVSLLEVYDTPAIVVNKPHNWYLGVAMDSGVVSLLVLLTMLGAFLVTGIRNVLIHPVNDSLKHLRIGVLVSVMGFMLVGIVNDSYVCVSPVFWFIFGVGWYAVSCNKVIKTN